MPYPPSVFIINSYRDARQADWLQEQLETRTAEVCRIQQRILEPEELSIGNCQQIGSCDHLIMLWSSNTESSQWLRRSWKLALQLRKPVTVIRLDRTAVPDRLCEQGCLYYDDLQVSFDPLPKRISGLQSTEPTVAPPKGQKAWHSSDNIGQATGS